MATTPEARGRPDASKAAADRSRSARRHGGALDAAVRRFGGKRDEWLDLSTGINPSPPPLPPLDPALWWRLPEAGLEVAAIAAARRFYGAPAESVIVAAPGSQALISALPSLLPRATVAIVGPTYGEHRAAFAAAGHRVVEVHDLAEVFEAVTIAVVVNPNNPDGRVFASGDLLALADRLARRSGLLVVDEAFADVDPSRSLAGRTGPPGLLVHRSFGKFFGLAGLRLGFALTEQRLARALSERLGAWAVSGPALQIGATLMGDAALCLALRETIARQAAFRDACLFARTELVPVGRTALFATVAHPRAAALHEALGRRLILTRPFDHSPTWLRFGNPRDEMEALRLGDALDASLDEVASGETEPGGTSERTEPFSGHGAGMR